jgi:hypothetical protein
MCPVSVAKGREIVTTDGVMRVVGANLTEQDMMAIRPLASCSL